MKGTKHFTYGIMQLMVNNEDYMIMTLTSALAPHLLFPLHQHEQHRRDGTFHAVLHHAVLLSSPFCSSIFAQNEHFLTESDGRKFIK